LIHSSFCLLPSLFCLLSSLFSLSLIHFTAVSRNNSKGKLRMRILVTNDDGIYSPGIKALAETAQEFGEVRIVAPDVEQSSMGHAITANRPLRYRATPIPGFEAYRVNGTPADCVALGVEAWQGADLVLSGINLGTNLGNSAWHSGTLAGAKQAVLLKLRGIAFSTPADEEEPNFAALKPHVRDVLQILLEESSAPLLNVNVPVEPKGIRWVRQSVRQYDGKIVRDTDPSGRELFWFTVIPIKGPEPDTDRWAFERNFITVTPLRLDLTDEAELARNQETAEKSSEVAIGKGS
jgi:5'-nucleotidase